MRLVLTGGGTGGHIYPALVVGRLAAESAAELFYFGSIRGQESKACAELSIPFVAFPSEPLYSLRTLRGMKALVRLQQSRLMARKSLRTAMPDVILSTGGYSAGPVVAAARDLKIPYVIHTADSIPARSSRMFAKQAAAFSCTFRSTIAEMTERTVVRTGQPIRRELRAVAGEPIDQGDVVLVVGGSQGSEFLNQTVPLAAARSPRHVKFMHASGPDHYKSTFERVERLGLAQRYQVVPYLKTEELVEAYRKAKVVVARSGGTLAELALFGLPSVLVPLPTSANDHQLHNAQEFVKMNAATILNQSRTTAENMVEAVMTWLENPAGRDVARMNLKEWDVPDAAEQIWKLVQGAAK